MSKYRVNRYGRSSSWMEKTVPIFIGVVFIIVIVWFIFVVFAVFKTHDHIKTQSIRSVVEQVWCGETKCLNGDLSKQTSEK